MTTVSIETYAAILLTLRIISVVFICVVLKKQVELFRKPIAERVRTFRKILFALMIAALITSAIPASIDVLTLLGEYTGRPTTVKPVSLIYTISWSLGDLIKAYLIWRLYKLAGAKTEGVEYTGN